MGRIWRKWQDHSTCSLPFHNPKVARKRVKKLQRLAHSMAQRLSVMGGAVVALLETLSRREGGLRCKPGLTTIAITPYYPSMLSDATAIIVVPLPHETSCTRLQRAWEEQPRHPPDNTLNVSGVMVLVLVLLPHQTSNARLQAMLENHLQHSERRLLVVGEVR